MIPSKGANARPETAPKRPPAGGKASWARALRYRDFLIVALMVRKDELFPSVKVGRVQNFHSWSPEMVPAGMSCLGFEYFCFEDDDLWDAPGGNLIALAKGSGADRSDRRRRKWSTPAWCASPRPIRSTTRTIAATLPPSGSISKAATNAASGRPEWHAPQDHAMMTAMLMARNILAGQKLYDIWNVNEDAEYHEAGPLGVQAALDSVQLAPERSPIPGQHSADLFDGSPLW